MKVRKEVLRESLQREFTKKVRKESSHSELVSKTGTDPRPPIPHMCIAHVALIQLYTNGNQCHCVGQDYVLAPALKNALAHRTHFPILGYP